MEEIIVNTVKKVKQKNENIDVLNINQLSWINFKTLIILGEAELAKGVDFAINAGKKKLMSLIKQDAFLTYQSGNIVGSQVIKDDGSISGSKTFPILEYVQWPLLKELFDSYQKNHKLELFEIGASSGRFAWKALLTGANVTINDLYANQLDKAHEFVEDNLPEYYNVNLNSIKGDILDIFNIAPSSKNKFDFVYSQNLIHFFNPIECKSFAKIVWDLLKPGGKAYITSQTFAVNVPLFGVYENELNSKQKLESKDQEVIFKKIVNNMKDNIDFISFLQMKYDSKNNLISINNPEHSEKVRQLTGSITNAKTKTTHYMAEKTLKKVFFEQGFYINDIKCGNNKGQEVFCFEHYAAKRDVFSALDAIYITIELEKPILSGVSSEFNLF
jgi:2-polyprenyl-3-methyl-5-hydroxy-6-metoxy-1,4-benzoquinol methylase